MGFVQQERAALCDALAEVGPDAPTLCAGWNAHDLAAHVWLRENDPSAAPGMFLPALAEVTAARTEQLKSRWHYPELVRQIRRGPGPVSLFALDFVDELANTTEYFVHAEDVRRPAGLAPRDTTQDFEDHIAKTLNRAAGQLFRKAACGIVLERTDRTQRMRAKAGSATVTVIGKPTELLLFAFGRMADADVKLVGAAGAKDDLLETHRGL